jgi:glycerophosphoryl diester phosphodiesterase
VVRHGRVEVLAHRGASAVAPENTMAAFRAARDLGADGVELDVQPSADGELVVIHDVTLDRTTSGSGNVFQADWTQLRSLDAGSWFSPTHRGERVPRLGDVLQLEELRFEVELKGYGARFLENVLRTVIDAGVLGRVEFTSFNVPSCCSSSSSSQAPRSASSPSHSKHGWTTTRSSM